MLADTEIFFVSLYGCRREPSVRQKQCPDSMPPSSSLDVACQWPSNAIAFCSSSNLHRVMHSLVAFRQVRPHQPLDPLSRSTPRRVIGATPCVGRCSSCSARYPTTGPPSTGSGAPRSDWRPRRPVARARWPQRIAISDFVKKPNFSRSILASGNSACICFASTMDASSAEAIASSIVVAFG